MKIKSFFISFFVLFTFLSYAQEKPKRILLVPYDRFDFQSKFSLDDIAKYNSWDSTDLVFTKYQNRLVDALSQPDSHISMFVLPEQELRQVKSLLPKEYKSEPTTHQGVQIENLVKSGKLKLLLENFQADYFLVMTEYMISPKLVPTKASYEGSKFLAWSVHKFTYEIYDAEGKLVAMANRYGIDPTLPKEENADTKGTLLKSLSKPYSKLLKGISKQIELYERKRKVVYKIK